MRDGPSQSRSVQNQDQSRCAPAVRRHWGWLQGVAAKLVVRYVYIFRNGAPEEGSAIRKGASAMRLHSTSCHERNAMRCRADSALLDLMEPGLDGKPRWHESNGDADRPQLRQTCAADRLRRQPQGYRYEAAGTSGPGTVRPRDVEFDNQYAGLSRARRALYDRDLRAVASRSLITRATGAWAAVLGRPVATARPRYQPSRRRGTVRASTINDLTATTWRSIHSPPILWRLTTQSRSRRGPWRTSLEEVLERVKEPEPQAKLLGSRAARY